MAVFVIVLKRLSKVKKEGRYAFAKFPIFPISIKGFEIRSRIIGRNHTFENALKLVKTPREIRHKAAYPQEVKK